MGFSNPIVSGGGALQREAIRSPNYVPGGPGWKIDRDGSVEFTNGIFRGRVEAQSGSFSGDLSAATVNGRAVPGGWRTEGSGDVNIEASDNLVRVLAGIQDKLRAGRLYRLEAEVYEILVEAGTAVDLTIRAEPATGKDATLLQRRNAKKIETNVGSFLTALVQPDATVSWDMVLTVQRTFGTGKYIVRAGPTTRTTLALYDAGSLP
jgi:hypothetical protein